MMRAESDTHAPRTAYPPAERQAHVDDYHGVQVADPYRWLEDPDAPASRTWIDEQNRLTRAWIDAAPSRMAIEKRLSELWNYERYTAPFKKGGKYFWWKNDGLQNQSVLYVADRLDATPRVLLDPNLLRADGTIAVGVTAVSEDGRWIAYQMSEAGSDWNSIRVRDVASGKDASDTIEWVKFSGLSWTHDGAGFYYSTYPEHDTSGKQALAHHKLYFHELGAPQQADAVVYERPDQPEWGFYGAVSDDGTLLVVSQTEGTEQKNRVYVRDLTRADAPFQALFEDFDAEYDFLGKRGARLFFRTDNGSANGRIVAVDLSQSSKAQLVEIVPPSADAIESALIAGERLIVTYLHDARNEVRTFGLDGKDARTLELPSLGAIGAWSGDPGDAEAFYTFTSFTTPTAVYRYDTAAHKSTLWHAPKTAFSPDDYVTTQVFYLSKDGTRVPMFLTHRRDVKPGPETPTLLYGYGGFNIPLKPTFSAANLVWMERGGTFAVANIRGGGEYGREWHESGTLERKQNVFDDFIAAAEWLIAKGYTSTPKLAIHGRSNGGLLVGACMTQRPDLFGACIPGVGVLDMLRYHNFTIGWAWASDYGRSDDARAFRYLMRYSPLHNLKDGTHYPPTLITTGDHDDRVVPAHSFKYAAALQHAQGGDAPILIRIETRGGHGAGKPTSMQIEEVADQWAFLERALGMQAPNVQARGDTLQKLGYAGGSR